MSSNLDDLTQRLIAAAKTAGADAADAMAMQGTSVSIDVRGGKLEHAERSEGIDIGLRVFVGQRAANVSASDVSESTLHTMAERAVAMAKEAPEDPNIGLADPQQLARSWDLDALELFDPAAEPEPEALQRDAAEAEAAALGYEGISQVQAAMAGYSSTQVHLAASNGFTGGYQRTNRGTSCVAIAGSGAEMERDSDGDSRIHQADLRSPTDIGQQAAERALARQNAKQPPTGAFPVLFDERVSSSLIGHLLAASNGASIARGSSWLMNALGEDILPKELSLIEDPHRARVTGSRPFDGEGLATRKRAIVSNGTLKGWTLDLATGRKLGLESTANAARGPGGSPSPSNWNIQLTQGSATKDDLIADMGTGLIVTSLMGSTINPNTGDYSRGASGFWVENGEVTHAINECTIAGNLRDMLRRILPANDARTHLSRVVPSLLIEGMTLAGS